jgi:hypothetical protein
MGIVKLARQGKIRQCVKTGSTAGILAGAVGRAPARVHEPTPSNTEEGSKRKKRKVEAVNDSDGVDEGNTKLASRGRQRALSMWLAAAR